jgi:hypothetical protein
VPSLFLFELIEPGQPLALPAGHQVVVAPGTDLGEVLLVRHAAVDDHRGSTSPARALLEQAEHVFQGSAILTIAFEDLVRLGEAIAIQDQPNHHLLAVGSLVSGVAALRFRIAQALPLEVGRGQVVEAVGIVEIEETFLALRQSAFNTLPIGTEAIQVAVQGIVFELTQIDPQDIAQRRSLHPSRHGVLRARSNQPVEHHDLAQQASPLRKANLFQDCPQAQPVPYLMPYVDRPGLSRFLHAHLIGMHRHDVVQRRRQTCPGRLNPAHERGHQWVRGLQRLLALEGRFHPPRQALPLPSRSGRQVSQRTDRLLPRALRRAHRLHQQIVVVRPLLVSLDRLADEHGDLYTRDRDPTVSSLFSPKQAEPTS